MQNEFYGRLRHFIDVVDPRTLFTSEVYNYVHMIDKHTQFVHMQKKLQESIQLLDAYRQGTLPPQVTDKQVTPSHFVGMTMADSMSDSSFVVSFFRIINK